MTTDYSKLDTAALVAAADALMAEITPGEWEYDEVAIVTYDDNGVRVYVVGGSWDGDIEVEPADAVFIAAAPALVRALLTRLRECVPASKFNVGDRVRVIGTNRHGVVINAEYTLRHAKWSYLVEWPNSGTLPLLSDPFGEDELELVTNG